MSKLETYRVPFSDNGRNTIVDINAILTRIEDRLDDLDGLRLGYFTTQRWEKDFLQEES